MTDAGAVLLGDQVSARAAGPPAMAPTWPDSRAAIGVITPSANVVVERSAIRLLRAFPRVSAHFSRVRVKGRADLSEDQYDLDAMASAAALLADAGPGVLLWAGSKGVQCGLERELALCERIRVETGVPTTTPTLALEALIRDRGIGAIGLISPYSRPYQAQLIDGFKRMGLACVAEAHAGIEDNLAYASVGAARIRAMARQVARARPDAILAWCTNFPAGSLAGAIEREVGVPFLTRPRSVSAGRWRASASTSPEALIALGRCLSPPARPRGRLNHANSGRQSQHVQDGHRACRARRPARRVLARNSSSSRETSAPTWSATGAKTPSPHIRPSTLSPVTPRDATGSFWRSRSTPGFVPRANCPASRRSASPRQR